jgi:hypothetical protein
MRTSNGGVNWSDQVSGTSNSLRSIYFVNSLTGWAVGDLGTILKTTSGGITGISKITGETPDKFVLYQNYPNPFNPKTIINFQLPRHGGSSTAGIFVKLAVYDVSGREVAILVNENLQPGKYDTEFDGNNMTSGIYFCRLTAGYYSETRKMILLK